MNSLPDRIRGEAEEELRLSESVQPWSDEGREKFQVIYSRRFRKAICEGLHAVTKSQPQPEGLWEAAAEWSLNHWLLWMQGGGREAFMLDYLKAFGYEALDLAQWQATGLARDDASQPSTRLELSIPTESANGPAQGHEEHSSHTWYFIRCQLTQSEMHPQRLKLEEDEDAWDLDDQQEGLSFWAPRRLLHLQSLHEHVKGVLGAEYATHFGTAPFARAGGFSGTTARLDNWLRALAQWINGGAPPSVVFVVLVFIRALRYSPSASDDAARAVPGTTDVAADPALAEKEEAEETVQVEVEELDFEEHAEEDPRGSQQDLREEAGKNSEELEQLRQQLRELGQEPCV